MAFIAIGTWDSLDSSLKEKLRALYSGKQADQLDKVKQIMLLLDAMIFIFYIFLVKMV